VPREESFVFTQVMKARGKIRELLRVAMFQPQVAATCNRENEATVETEQRRGVAFGFLVLSIPGATYSLALLIVWLQQPLISSSSGCCAT
jgi:hypothetical protein